MASANLKTISVKKWSRKVSASRIESLIVLRKWHYVFQFETRAGTRDEISLYEVAGRVPIIVVLSVNRVIGYAGLEVFDVHPPSTPGGTPPNPRELGDLFVQSDYEAADILGPKGFDYESITIAKRMYDRWSELDG
jgi:hypothetical protein